MKPQATCMFSVDLLFKSLWAVKFYSTPKHARKEALTHLESAENAKEASGRIVREDHSAQLSLMRETNPPSVSFREDALDLISVARLWELIHTLC